MCYNFNANHYCSYDKEWYIGFFLCLILLLVGCTKAEDKIRGIWQISSIHKNNVETVTESPGEVESLLSNWSFYRSKILLINYYRNNIYYKSSGNWDIDEKNDYLTVSFSDAYKEVERIYRIEKFKSNELKVSFKEGNDEWLLVFSLQYSFQDYDF